MDSTEQNARSRAAATTALQTGKPAIGTFVGLGSVPATEICARSGFDWLLIDLEHGAGGEGQLNAQTHTAARFDALSIVRVETAARIRCSRALDLGADGIMAPRLDSAAEAQAFVRHLRYPPAGDRGVASYHSAAGYGLVPDYFTVPPRPLAFVQIESRAALDAVEEIAAVDGVDVLFVGPRDLSSSLGVAPSLEDPTFAAACASVVRASHARGISAGVLAGSQEAVAGFVDLGFTAIAVGSDSSFMGTGGSQAVSAAAAAFSG